MPPVVQSVVHGISEILENAFDCDVVHACGLGIVLRQSYYGVQDVWMACDCCEEEFANGMTVREAHLLWDI